MKKSLLLILFLSILGLAACNLSTGGAPTAEPPTSTPMPSPTPLIITLPPPEDLDRVTPTAVDHAQGPIDAIVTMIHYGDFQCIPCADVARSLAILRERYPESLRVVWRHYPDVANHDKATLALAASEAAAAEDRFWEMHDLLFAEQDGWIDLTPEQFRAALIDYAGTLQLNIADFEAALDQDLSALADRYRMEALALDLRGIPALLINGQPYSGRYDLYGLDDAYRFFALEARHYPHQPDLFIDLTADYRAVLVTERGNVEIDLFVDEAPVTVNNFVYLARDGWYNNITFHRVLPGLFAQTGDPSGTGLGGPGYTIFDERDNGLTFDREGRVAMASTRGVPNSGGSQFFITYGPLTPAWEWNGQFAIFGQVTNGMDVLRALTPRDPLDPLRFPDPPPGDRLITVEIYRE